MIAPEARTIARSAMGWLNGTSGDIYLERALLALDLAGYLTQIPVETTTTRVSDGGKVEDRVTVYGYATTTVDSTEAKRP